MTGQVISNYRQLTAVEVNCRRAHCRTPIHT